MRRSAFPERRPRRCLALLSALLIGLQPGSRAQAQVPLPPVTAPITTPLPVTLPAAPGSVPAPGAAVAPATCGAEDALLQVMVGASNRGDQLVKLALTPDGAASAVLVPASVFLPAEQALIAGTTECDGVLFALPAAGVRVRYDQATQSVRVTPVLTLLGNNVLDLRALAPAAQGDPLVPAFGVSFGASGFASYGQGSASADGVAYLGAGGVRGNLGGYAGVLVGTGTVGTGTGLVFRARALAQYVPRPGLALYAAINADPAVTDPGFGSSTFSGVALAAQGGFERTAPELRVELPLEADVDLYVSSRLVRSFHAAAGLLTIRNVPLQQFGSTDITVYITDSTGTREVSRSVQLPYQALPPGAYLASASAGSYSDSGYSVAGSLQLGLQRGWSVLAQGQYSPRSTFLLGQGLYHGPLWDYSLAVQAYSAAPEDLNYLISLGAGRSFGALSLVGALQVPLNGALVNGFAVPQLGLTASYSAPRLLLIGTGAVGLGSGANGQSPWLLSGSATYFPDSGLPNASFPGSGGSLTLSGSLRPGAAQVSVSAGLRLTPKLQLLGGANASSLSGVGQQNAFAALQYTPDGYQTATIAAGNNLLAASYVNNGRVLVAAAADTQSASARVNGAVVFVDGRPQLQQTLTQRALLVHTGLARIPLLLNGSPVGVTDGEGNLLIQNLPLGQTSTLSVDLRALPLGVSVAEREREVVPPLSGVTVIDWRGNFRLYRFVQFFWRPGERAAGADLAVNGEKIPLDDEGYGLTPTLPGAVSGTLTSQDGQRRCSVIVPPQGDAATCSP